MALNYIFMLDVTTDNVFRSVCLLTGRRGGDDVTSHLWSHVLTGGGSAYTGSIPTRGSAYWGCLLETPSNNILCSFPVEVEFEFRW